MHPLSSDRVTGAALPYIRAYIRDPDGHLIEVGQALGAVYQAADLAAQAITQARARHNRLSLVDALRVQGLVLIRQERWEEAERSLEEGLDLARSMPYPYAEGRLLHVYGQMHAQKGERGLARERLEAA
jgi:Flp pilus assembly protein TadD